MNKYRDFLIYLFMVVFREQLSFIGLTLSSATESYTNVVALVGGGINSQPGEISLALAEA